MSRQIARVLILAAGLLVAGAPARGQYRYPGGYAGWNGWGASTVGGDAARGMGVFAAGAGSYNEQTAEARSMNANTAMQMNQYMYGVNTRNAKSYNEHQAAMIGLTTETAQTNYKRVHDNPNPHDIHNGDALNVVLDELTNPNVYTQVVQKATQPVESQLVKEIEFQYAAQMIAISLDDLSARGVPDVLETTPAFQPACQAIRAVVAKAGKEAGGQGQISPETLRECRTAIKALEAKVAETLPMGTRQRDASDNYLKALYGLSNMLETPNVVQFLKGLDSTSSTTLGHLITFMHSFNLRFGAAKNPIQEAAYDQLYPLLVTLRDQADARGPNPMTAQAPAQDPSKVTSFFSGMHLNHFQPQPAPNTSNDFAPPRPGLPR